MDRRFGFFRCTNCRKTWQSSHLYCRKGTEEVLYKQECKACNTACMPYKTEKIRCSLCSETECICTDENKKKKRNINPAKPHLARLCHKCQAGHPCTSSDSYDDGRDDDRADDHGDQYYDDSDEEQYDDNDDPRDYDYSDYNYDNLSDYGYGDDD